MADLKAVLRGSSIMDEREEELKIPYPRINMLGKAQPGKSMRPLPFSEDRARPCGGRATWTV